MMRCVTICPELDFDNSPHCTCRTQEDINYMDEKYPDGCPAGNIPIWEEVKNDECN